MNDEKLKKNMAEILFPVLKGSRISCNEENACKQCWFPCEVDRLADSLADALIAAGIGDVKEAEKEYRDAIFLAVTSQTMTSERSRYIELNKNIAEHRAEVAERALDLCETAYILSLNHRATEGVSGQAIASDLGIHKFFMEQAEKELAEEAK